jgi:hypothetical protein
MKSSNLKLVYKSRTPPKRDNTLTCYLRSQPIQRFVAGQQLRKHATSIGDVARQPPPCNNGSTVGSGVFYVVRPEAISRQ